MPIKKPICILISCLLAVCLLACGKTKLAGTPTEEYQRIANLGGADKIFDFSTVKTFTMNQTILTYGTKSDLTADKGWPAKETLNYLFDRRNEKNVKSLYSSVTLNTGDPVNSATSEPKYDTNKFVYTDNRYGRVPSDPNITSSATNFDSYEEYYNQENKDVCHDYTIQTALSLPNQDLFANIDGGKSEDGKRYNLSAKIKDDKIEDFYAWLTKFYGYKKFIASGVNQFLAPKDIENARLDITTTSDYIINIVATIEGKSNFAPIDVGKVKIVSETTFSLDKFSENIIQPPKWS